MSTPPLLSEGSPRRRATVKKRLDAIHGTFGRAFLDTDPLGFVHRYRSDRDREIVAFLAASLAFGNVRAIRSSVAAVLAAMGGSPRRFIDRFDPEGARAAVAPLYHRWIRGEDFLALFGLLRRICREWGSLEAFFMAGHEPGEADVGRSLVSFTGRARSLRPAPRRGGSVAPFFPSPADGSACKRLNLFLRWMVRDGDGMDLGIWKGIRRRQLVLPLDTHLTRMSRALGLTRRKTPGWSMAVEATRSLALLDPDDPVKYDFALSRLGILDLCLHANDPLECGRCPPPKVRERRTAAGRRSVGRRGAARRRG